MRPVLLLVLAVLWVPESAFCRSPDSFDSLLWSPLVVQGTVEDVGPKYFTHQQLYPYGLPNATVPPLRQTQAIDTTGLMYDINLISIRVTAVLKGRCDTAVLDISSRGSDYRGLLRRGQEIVICAYPSPLFGGSYVINDLFDIYARTGSLWIRGIHHPEPTPPNARLEFPAPKRLPELTLQEIVTRTERSSMPTIARESDVIVYGEVVSLGQREIADGAQVDEVHLRTGRVLKGAPAAGMSFIMKHKSWGAEYGTLDAYAPFLPGVGESWLVFLKSGPDGYYPFAGINGMLRVDGERFVYGPVGGSLPYTRAELEQVVETEVDR